MHLPSWLRKSLVVMVTILTFGLVTPTSLLPVQHEEDKTPRKAVLAESLPDISGDEASQVSREDFIKEMVHSAEKHSFEKFGEKIKPVIESEFQIVILPNIEKAIAEVAEQYTEENLHHLSITETASAGVSERIFHIADEAKQKDVIRFHVRRDHPPQQGYWFNFHYHTAYDQFQTHHELGSIYWDKNTPPKWMS
ncbi:YpjP family protein [Cytobacillus sp. FSL K6-0265]|uniref:YpjP family protein n=1 Tax=Cytobacillus sp. FSL K6-0265 TaxID=2921448 RepID=UPI004046A53B